MRTQLLSIYFEYSTGAYNGGCLKILCAQQCAGFLGAGKTTLVNYVVTENHGLRIAVIVNEYGDSEGIERPLVKGPDVRIGIEAMVSNWELRWSNAARHCWWFSVPCLVEW